MNKVLFRPHRGSLKEAMEGVREVSSVKDIVYGLGLQYCEYLSERYVISDVLVELYDERPDDRIGWDKTYIVRIDGYGVLGFTNGPLS